MIPDAATIARRRHTVTIFVRAGIVVFACWIARDLALWLGQMFEQLWEYGVATTVSNIPAAVLHLLPTLVLLVVLILFHAHLVRWIVPTPRPDHLCPKCNYSLKDLKSPICPECGTSLRG